MAEPYMSEIRIFAFNFAPRNWTQCNGQTLSIQSNQALFALVGTTYGGNGVQTFGLPNLQGRVPLHLQPGQYDQGQMAGAPTVQLNATQIPQHTHTVNANTVANTSAPSATVVPGGGGVAGYGTALDTPMNTGMIGSSGGSQAHTNMQPYLVLNYCIAVAGLFPSRN